MIVSLLLAHVAGMGLSLRMAGTEQTAQLHPKRAKYARECGKKVHTSHALAQLGARNPGAGMHPEELSRAEVLKDGFWMVDCVKDSLLEHGDKFGNNAASYKLGLRSNVSIVRYDEHVPKEDRSPMTHEVCFEFCRSVPLMGFFGLAHGRDCYCAPYYQAMAGDSSECDAVCEGEPATMCGGMSKSSVFQMHACGDTKGELADVDLHLDHLATKLGKVAKGVCKFSSGMQGSADTLQKMFGGAGDPEASALMQGAKSSASDLRATCKSAKDKLQNIEDVEARSAAFKEQEADFGNPKVMAEAEAIIEQGKASIQAGRATKKKALRILKKLRGTGLKGTLKPYVPVTYLVDKAFESAPSTCGGTTIGMPLLAVSPETCAAACSDHVQECDGFSFFAHGGGPSLCFLLSKITSTQYYTGCKAPTLLQTGQRQHQPTPPAPKSDGPTPPAPKPTPPSKKSNPGDTKCYAKFQNFEGVTIKPDPSGKCEKCLKTATKADRCFQ